ncbi:hypothetical protein E2C01_005522 [Portunus trituberculatus]|uniref:Uncharacterized protein n=1 Tax=Portunus trituberculatus TaxID=210409 RepID=A0A5B7CSY8_PORTR|nr:hypothetical protein [Portunus trituberculatus]
MMSFLRLRDSRDSSPYSSSAKWVDKDKTSLSALLEADVEGPAVAGSACFTGLKKEDVEEGPAVTGSAVVIGTACCDLLYRNSFCNYIANKSSQISDSHLIHLQ